MPRKTRRVGKKKRNTTHNKRKGVKRTRKYKILKGGLGSNDYENIGINDKFIFQSGYERISGNVFSKEDKINEFKNYVFGSEEHAKLWEKILLLCHTKEIPFYILTSGSKVGIIRTLQLLELSDYVTEVLCNREEPDLNPDNSKDRTRNEFKGKNKYQIIEKVINLNCKKDGYKGLFFDNEPRNETDKELCTNVEFRLAEGRTLDNWGVRNRFLSFVYTLSGMSGRDNPFSRITNQLYNTRRTNLVELAILQTVHDNINDGTINVFISDFDGTMSPWCGVFHFHDREFTQKFSLNFGVEYVR